MREIIREHSIFLQLKRAGVEPITFANTYTQNSLRSDHAGFQQLPPRLKPRA